MAELHQNMNFEDYASIDMTLKTSNAARFST